MFSFKKLSVVQYGIIAIWACNCLLASFIAVRDVWLPYMDAWGYSYTKIQSDPFDGTVMPITYIPDWSKVENQDKTKRFEDIAISDYIPIPLYDALSLSDTRITTKSSLITHYTYITGYMWSYRLNYKENDGSHLWVDIRAPIGTPVLSIANGVVVRTIEADATGNKIVVIRHDTVPINGKNETIYSWYLHLSEILVTEWTKVKKGDMIARVGMTGLATTPHLHLQIDKSNAPFHPYWPFTSTDSRQAGLGFFDSINAWLWKDNAIAYTIHPMNFINTYLGGIQMNSAPQVSNTNAVGKNTTSKNTIQVASYNSFANIPCENKRFGDVSEKSTLWKMLYPLVDTKCMFQENGDFDPKKTVTLKDALMMTMDYYNIDPETGTSPFLDIPINDTMQWYALSAYKLWILDGNYAYPETILTKEDFVKLIMKIAKPLENPGQIRIFADVDAMNPNFQNIQTYAFMTRAKWGKFYPKNILTKAVAVQMLANIEKVGK